MIKPKETNILIISCCVCLCVCVQLKSMLHNINFFLDSLVKGDLREVKGVRTFFFYPMLSLQQYGAFKLCSSCEGDLVIISSLSRSHLKIVMQVYCPSDCWQAMLRILFFFFLLCQETQNTSLVTVSVIASEYQ